MIEVEKEDTKDKIIRQALLLIKDKGFDRVSINEICEKCGITKGTFYYHFKSKEALLDDFYGLLEKQSEAQALNLLKADSVSEQLWQTFENLISTIVELGPNLLKQFFKVEIERSNQFFSLHLNPVEKERPMRQLQLFLIAKGQKSGEIRSELSAEKLYSCFFAVLLGTAFDWSAKDGSYSDSELKRLKVLFNYIFLPATHKD